MGEPGEVRAPLARVEAASGPDRRLDVAIAAALGQPQDYFAQFATDVDGRPWVGWSDVDGPEFFTSEDRWSGGGRSWVAPAYTSCLDAAVALVERLFPGGGWCAARAHNCPQAEGKPFFADVASREFIEDLEASGPSRGVIADAGGHTPALALCAALLKALAAPPPTAGGPGAVTATSTGDDHG